MPISLGIGVGITSRPHSSTVGASPYNLLYWQNFDDADTTALTSLGWVEASGTWTVQDNRAKSDTAHTICHYDLGARPAEVYATYHATLANGKAGIFMRYIDTDNYYLCRWDLSASLVEIYEKVAGTATLIDSAALTPDSADDEPYSLSITDDGSDIVVNVVGYSTSVTASNGGVNFTNDHLEATKIGFRAGGANSGLKSIRCWENAPTYDERTTVSPCWGAKEWWTKCCVRYVGTNDRTYFGWVSVDGEVQVRHYDHTTKTFSAIKTVVELAPTHNVQAKDDHNAPGIAVASDGKVLVFVCVHTVNDEIDICRRHIGIRRAD